MGNSYVVILTGGDLPGQEAPETGRIDIEVSLQLAGLAIRTVTEDALARKVAAAAFRHGYERGAHASRTVAVWVLDGKEEAERFAEFVTREIDPAYVKAALSPLNEILNAADEARQRALPDGVPS